MTVGSSVRITFYPESIFAPLFVGMPNQDCRHQVLALDGRRVKLTSEKAVLEGELRDLERKFFRIRDNLDRANRKVRAWGKSL